MAARRSEGQPFHSRIYFYLDETLFDGTKASIPVKVGQHRHEVDFHELDRLKAFDREDSFGQDTVRTFDTGRGTEHDDSEIRQRAVFLFEEIYSRPTMSDRDPGSSWSRATVGRVRLAGHKASEAVLTWLGWRPFEYARQVPSLYFRLRESKGAFTVPSG